MPNFEYLDSTVNVNNTTEEESKKKKIVIGDKANYANVCFVSVLISVHTKVYIGQQLDL